MSKTQRRVVAYPHHKSAVPYTRVEKHKPSFGNFPNEDYYENRYNKA